MRILILLMIIPTTEILAQLSAEEHIQNILSKTVEADNELLFNKLLHYAEHPINLNRCTEADLQSLGLLKYEQIEALLAYRTNLGPFHSIYEIQAIEGFTREVVYQLAPFVEVTYARSIKERFQSLQSSGYNYSMASYRINIEKNRGLSSGLYTGPPGRAQMRSKLNSPGSLSAGLVAQKDAGEKWLNHRNTLPDFLAGHLYVEDLGLVDKFVAGNYKLQFGQGLTVGSGFMTGKNADVIASTRQQTLGILPYSSMTEYDFFQGAAMEFGVGENISLTTFYSKRRLDASVEEAGDTTVVRTIRRSGLHRTQSELDGMNQLNELSYGTALALNLGTIEVGAVYLGTQFSDSIAPRITDYNQFYFSGKTANNFSVFLNYQHRNINWFSEVAKSYEGGIGWTSGIMAAFGEKVDMSLLARSYQPDFYSFHGRPFSEQSTARNESGIYWGIQISPSAKWKISAYHDYYKLPWFSYSAISPSQGSESLVRVNYNINKLTSSYLQLKIENRETNLRDSPNPTTGLRKTINLTMNFDYGSDDILQFRTRLQVRRSQIKMKTRGILMFQDAVLNFRGAQLTSRILLFDVDDFQSRLYTYEKDLLFNFYTPSFIGQGIRYFLLARVKPAKFMTMRAKWSQTIYHNQTSVGSGYEQINGNKKSEFGIQLSFSY